MYFRIPALSLVVATLALPVAAQDPVGTFRGALKPSKSVPQIPPNGLPVALTLVRAEDGYLEGTMEVAGAQARLKEIEEKDGGWAAETSFMGIGTAVRFALVDDALEGRLQGGGFTVDFRAERWNATDPPGATVAAAPVAIAKLSAEDWFEDLLFLEQEAPKLHMKWFEGMTEQQWSTAVDRVWQDVAELEPAQIVVRIAQLIAMRGDSHTTFAFTRLPEFGSAPVVFEQFPDGVFVQGVAEEHADLVGGRLVRIGETPIDEVLAAVATTRASENEQWKRGNVRLLNRPAVLYGLDILPDAGLLPLVVERDGVESELTLQRGHQAMAWALTEEATPLWLTRTREPYWFAALQDGETMYFAYNQCFSDPRRPFGSFAAELVEAVEKGQPQRLFIDLRNNGGGGSRVLEPVIDWLQGHEVLNHPSRLFVAIGKNTFSSSMLNATHFRERTRATIVGEPTGGKPNAYGEIRMVRLPRSGIGFWFSTKYFSSVEGNPPSVEPDRRIDLTAADYFAGRDPVLAAALAVEPAGPQWDVVAEAGSIEGVWRGAFEVSKEWRSALPEGALEFSLAVARKDDGTVRAAVETVVHPEPLAEASYDEDKRALTGRLALPGFPEGTVTFTFGRQTVRASLDAGRAQVGGTGLRLRGQDPRVVLVRGEFEEVVADASKTVAAKVLAKQLVELWSEDAGELNTLAWRLLTEESYGNRFDEVALEASQRSNELTEHGDWRHLDTLALAEFRAGLVEEAVAHERRALELVGDDSGRADVEAALRRFEARLKK